MMRNTKSSEVRNKRADNNWLMTSEDGEARALLDGSEWHKGDVNEEITRGKS